jgi:hypothetical protein
MSGAVWLDERLFLADGNLWQKTLPLFRFPIFIRQVDSTQFPNQNNAIFGEQIAIF